jgi:hypothetical protein
MNKLVPAAAAYGVFVTIFLVYLLTVAYRSFPLANYVLENGVPVLYYGEANVFLISGAIGLCVSLVVLYLGGSSRGRNGRRKGTNWRFLGYGGVGFLTIVVPALMMDPAALSVGLGVVIVWKMLASQQADARTQESIYEKKPIAITNS